MDYICDCDQSQKSSRDSVHSRITFLILYFISYVAYLSIRNLVLGSDLNVLPAFYATNVTSNAYLLDNFIKFEHRGFSNTRMDTITVEILKTYKHKHAKKIRFTLFKMLSKLRFLNAHGKYI